jgi:hypothetical protein
MKNLVAILAIILLATTTAWGRRNAIKIEDTHYAVNLAQVNTGSGHGPGYSMNGAIIKGRKSLEVGLIYNEQEEKIAGGDFKYRIFLGNLYTLQDENKIYKPYLQYNLMYQKGMSHSSELVQLGGETFEVESEPGTVATMGHYLSFGNKIKLFDRAFFDTSLGLGVYQGSMDPVNGPDTWGIHGENNGMTFAFKIGFGYTFN